jgi:hypothetical protein
LRGAINTCDVAVLFLANAVSCALAESQAVTPGALKSHSIALSLPLQDPPSEGACRTLLSKQTDERGKGRNRYLLKVAESGEPQFKPFSMRALAVGDELCIFSFSGEMFAEYQLYTDKVSPFKYTFVFNYTNGYDGYVATKADYDLDVAGGYEALGHPSSARPWLLPHPSCEKIIKEGVTHLLSELKSSESQTRPQSFFDPSTRRREFDKCRSCRSNLSVTTPCNVASCRTKLIIIQIAVFPSSFFIARLVPN